MQHKFKLPITAVGLLLTSGMTGPAVRAADDAWNYRTDAAGAGFETSMRLVPLDSTAPEDLVIDVDAAHDAVFGQFQYGSFDSIRVALMIVPHDGDDATLYIDSNRDRRIAERDRIGGTGPVWSLPLNAEFVDGDPADGNPVQNEPRQLLARYAKGALSIGTAGCIQGAIRFSGRQVAVRRIDADANGQFADRDDFVWLDMNGDSKWNVFTERFPFRVITRLEGQGWTCAADECGLRFSLLPIEGTGTLNLDLSGLLQRGLNDISVVLSGRSGSIVHLDGRLRQSVVPADDYRPVSLTATFERAEAPREWTFEFVRNGPQGDEHRIRVEADATVTFNPLDGLQLGVDVNRSDATYVIGATIVASPTLTTSDGLRIQSARFGSVGTFLVAEPKALVALIDTAADRTIDEKRCGFT